MEAETSIIGRIDEMNREMRGRLVDLQTGVDALLDKDYRAAILHLEEASRTPARAPGELQAARSKLFDAWGAASTPMRKYLVAQHLAVVYGLLDDTEMVRRWLKTCLEQVQAEVSGQVSRLHQSVIAYLLNPRKSPGNARKDALHLKVRVYSREGRPISMAEARNAVKHPFVVPSRPRDGLVWLLRERAMWEGFMPRNADLEGWLSGLAELDAESAAACRLCEIAEVPFRDMPLWQWQTGVVRVYKGKAPSPWRVGQEQPKSGVLIRFSQFVAAEFTVSGNQDSPICQPLPTELRKASNWQRADEPLFEETWDYDARAHPDLWEMGTCLPYDRNGVVKMMCFG